LSYTPAYEHAVSAIPYNMPFMVFVAAPFSDHGIYVYVLFCSIHVRSPVPVYSYLLAWFAFAWIFAVRIKPVSDAPGSHYVCCLAVNGSLISAMPLVDRSALPRTLGSVLYGSGLRWAGLESSDCLSVPCVLEIA